MIRGPATRLTKEEAGCRVKPGMTIVGIAPLPYMAPMLDDVTTKRLRWRAHHRGTKEADRLIGGFFDAHHEGWSAEEQALFETMLEEQDVDIMAWAIGTQAVPERYQGAMMTAMQRLDYLPIDR